MKGTPHRFEAEHRAHLKDENRRRVQPAQGILDRAAPTTDEVCADVGCGNGYLAIPFAVRCQVVLAIDAQREMLSDLMRSAGEFERLKLVPLQAEASRLPLTGASVDRVLMVNMLHEVEDNERYVHASSLILWDQPLPLALAFREGTRGEIYGDGESIEVYDFLSDTRRVIETNTGDASLLGGHGGGDYGLMDRFVAAIAAGDQGLILSGAEESLETHRMTFAAERARLEHRVVDL